MNLDNKGASYDGKRITPYNKTFQFVFDFRNSVVKNANFVYNECDDELDKKFLIGLEIV